MLRTLIPVVVAIACAAPAVAVDPEVRTLAEGASSPMATVDAVAWLEGRWIAEAFGGTVEETYMAPLKGQMPGIFRASRDGVPWMYEIVLFAEVDGSLVYRVKHFHTDFTGWEAKDQSVDFRLVAVEPDAVYFDGITFARVGDGVVVSLRFGSGDNIRSEVIRYRRAG